ncbi:MAG: hypothetical protein J0H43_09270 [Actinobacteria bacterium]|nr:hypothetical protein [Actinomycetota bacterium]
MGGWDRQRVRDSASWTAGGPRGEDFGGQPAETAESLLTASASTLLRSRDRSLLRFVMHLLDVPSCDEIITATLDSCFTVDRLTQYLTGAVAEDPGLEARGVGRPEFVVPSRSFSNRISVAASAGTASRPQ